MVPRIVRLFVLSVVFGLVIRSSWRRVDCLLPVALHGRLDVMLLPLLLAYGAGPGLITMSWLSLVSLGRVHGAQPNRRAALLRNPSRWSLRFW